MIHFRKSLFLVLIVVLITMTACSTKKAITDATNAPSSQATTESPASTPESTPEDVVVDMTIAMISDENIKFDTNESYESNHVIDLYEKEVGVKLKSAFIVDQAGYDQKIRLSIASNSIPDLTMVKRPEFEQLVKADMLADLSEVYENNASELTKAWYQVDGGKMLGSAKIGGKLLGIPKSYSPYDGATYLMVRKDWLNKLNLPEPKTMADVLKISEAFTTQDPDGNNKEDTFGLSAINDDRGLFDGGLGLAGFFNGYHAYPQKWIKDASGNLVFGSIQPEMKTALQQVQSMYKAGQIDPEFITKDQNKEAELIAQGRLGMGYANIYFVGTLQRNITKDEKISQEWAVYPIPSIDNKPAKLPIGLGTDTYYVVKKGYKHPEAAIKILNKWIQMETKKSAEDYAFYHGKNYVGEPANNYWKLNPMVPAAMNGALKTGELLPTAIDAKDPSSLGDNQWHNFLYGLTIKYLEGVDAEWDTYFKAKTDGAWQRMYNYYLNDQYINDEFYGAFTPEMLEKKTILDAKQTETFIKIILGKLPIEAFDQFVEEWKSLGGELMTTEVNTWYKSVQ